MKTFFSGAMGLLLVLCSTTALADLEIYGKAHVSIDFSQNNDKTAGNEDSVITLANNNSRIGLRGEEDLGGGLGFFWQAENVIDIDNGGWGSPRNTFAGLKGDYGSVRVGKLDTPYKSSTNKLDVFSDSRADYNAVIGNIQGEKVFNNRAPNVLVYESPQSKAIRGAIAYITNYEGDDNLTQTTSDDKKTGTSLSLSYSDGSIYLGAAHEILKDLTGSADGHATKIGGSWGFQQGTKLGLVLEEADKGAGEARTAIYLNAAHTTGNTILKAGLGMLDDVDSTTNSGATHLALGIVRVLSRNTQVYGLYVANNNDDNASYGLPEGDSIPATTGESVSSLSFGVVSKFSSL